MTEDGGVLPAGGTLTAFDPPSGPGIRVDTFGYTGYATTQSFDSLLAKLVVSRRAGMVEQTLAKAYRALCAFRIEGVATNIGLLQNLLLAPEVRDGAFHTRLVDERLPELVVSADHPRLFHDGASARRPVWQARASIPTIRSRSSPTDRGRGEVRNPRTPVHKPLRTGRPPSRPRCRGPSCRSRSRPEPRSSPARRSSSWSR